MAETTQFNLKIPTELDAAIKAAAKKSKKKVSDFVRDTLAEALGYDGPGVKMGAPVKSAPKE